MGEVEDAGGSGRGRRRRVQAERTMQAEQEQEVFARLRRQQAQPPPPPPPAPYHCQRPWCTEPGSHRWLGARVAWPFDGVPFAGTVTGWKHDSLLRCVVWFISYDDGDSEVYDVAHMRFGLQTWRSTEAKATDEKELECEEVEAPAAAGAKRRKAKCRTCRHRRSLEPETGQCRACSPAEGEAATAEPSLQTSSDAAAPCTPPAPSRRCSAPGLLSTGDRVRRPIDPDQEVFPFPILISPRRLAPAPSAQQGRPPDRPAVTRTISKGR